MPLPSWEIKTNRSVQRLGCLDCGAHTLIGPLSVPRCQCCGGRDLHSVATADAQLRRLRDARDQAHQLGEAPLTIAL